MTNSAISAPPELDELCVNTLRFLAVDAVEKAKSGHPGLPLGSASMAYALWDRSLKFNPRDPLWHDRDRFVLSAGHGCALLYALLHVTGFDLALEELERFRQWGSKTPGHPEYGKTPGVEVTTGPLGRGLSNAVGMAIAEVALAARFNRPGYSIVDHFTYVLAGDGDLEEGISSEAGSDAGHLRLGKLIVLYADNHITIEGSTELAFTEDRMARFVAFGWHVQRVEQSNDIELIAEALNAARRSFFSLDCFGEWIKKMREAQVSFPELAMLAGSRAVLGAGLGLLLADRLSVSQRQAVGWTLLSIGVVITIPLAFEVLGKVPASILAD